MLPFSLGPIDAKIKNAALSSNCFSMATIKLLNFLLNGPHRFFLILSNTELLIFFSKLSNLPLHYIGKLKTSITCI